MVSDSSPVESARMHCIDSFRAAIRDLSETLALLESEKCSGHGPEALRLALSLEGKPFLDRTHEASHSIDAWITSIRKAQESEVSVWDVPLTEFQQRIIRAFLPKPLKNSNLLTLRGMSKETYMQIRGWPFEPTRMPDGVSIGVSSKHYYGKDGSSCSTVLHAEGLLMPSEILLRIKGNIANSALNIHVHLRAEPGPSSPVDLEVLRYRSAATIKRYQKCLATFDCDDARDAIRILENALKAKKRGEL